MDRARDGASGAPSVANEAASEAGHPPSDATTGERIRSLRERAGLSQAELARRLGVNQGRVSALEREGADLRVSTLLRLAKALQCRPSAIDPRLI